MKTTTKIGTLLIIMGLSFSACDNNKTIHPSSNITVQERAVTNYTGIEVSSAFEVDIEFSATEEKVEVEASANLQPYIEVDNYGNNLRIKFRNHTNIRGNATLRVHILTKTPLNYFAAAGACHITLKNKLIADDVTISLSGASHFLGEIEASSVTTFIDGASGIDLNGSADLFYVDASGASQIGEFGMVVQNANVQLSGASNASLSVNGVINVDGSGASIFRYKGNAVFDNLNLSGGAQIMKID